jgi:Arc/MetJ-type ribon-helix-helix transcriptional regulator
MNVNLHLTGELEAFINDLVHRGLAANKTEAIRLAIIRYYEDLMLRKKALQEPLNQSSMEAQWNNPNDENASGFYQKRYLHAGKA